MEEIKEEWRAVPGYEGYYEVSNLGQVRRLDRYVTMKNGVTRFMKGRTLTQGNYNSQTSYRGVTLCKNGIMKKASVHRLVAEAFIPNPDNLPEINHIDENKRNNRVDNLEWCDRKYNNNYGSMPFRNAMKLGKPVIQKKNGVIINAYPSMGVASVFTGAPEGGISACCRGEISTSGGYEWEFAPWCQ